MEWSTTLSDWTRREAVLVAALAAAGATIGLAVLLGAAWLAVIGVVVAALGAVARLVIAVRRSGLERRRERAESARRLLVPPTPITEVDPTLIGVDRAEQTILPGAGIPDYVPRVVDDQLRQAVAAAVDGTGPWIVVVHGPSKVGKSRTLFQALLHGERTTPLTLVAPTDAAALKLLVVPGQGLRLGADPAVLWLDDLEPFLNDGVRMETLREWRAGVSGRIVAATYGGKGSELIAGSRTSGLATIASEVFQHACEIPLQVTTTSELAALRPQLDAGEAASLERHGLAAYLVAGPALERKLNTGRHEPGGDACPEGVAVVHAAVDWARCGRTDPVTHDTLRRLWPSYLPEGVPPTDDRFDRALTWALAPVAGSIGLLSRTGGYQAFDYVVRLLRDTPDAPAVREECWTVALDGAADALVFAVGVSAYRQSRRTIALDAFARARASSVDELAAAAAYNLGVVTGELDRGEEEIAAYDAVVARFGHATEATPRESVAKALINKGVALGALGRGEEALGVYDEVVARFGDATEPAQREQVAKALFNKAVRLGALGRAEEALGAYDEVVARFGDATEPALREQVAKALFNKGVDLRDLGRGEEALRVYDEVLARFGDATEPALRAQVAKASVNKGVALSRLDRGKEALGVFDDVVAGFGDATEPALREQVAKALLNKGVALGVLGRGEEALGVYDEVVARFGDATEAALREQVAKALFNKGVALGVVDRGEEALGVYDEVVARFGDATEATLREIVARALVNKGVALGVLGRGEEALGVFDEVVARFGDATEPTLRESVARGLVNKGVDLGELSRGEEALRVYDEVVARFGDATEPALREQVAKALINKGVALGVLDRGEEALGVFDEVVARFGDATEPALREIVASARDFRGNTAAE